MELTSTQSPPSGPVKIAVSYTVGFQLTANGLITSTTGAAQKYLTDSESKNAIALGGVVNLPSPSDPDMATCIAACQVAFQALFTAKGF